MQAFENQNQEMSEISIMFFDNPEDVTFGADYLDKTKLDFSIDSLQHVNEYLETIPKDQELERTWNKIVLRCGAYVGEVLRRSSLKCLEWIAFETAQELENGKVKSLAYEIGTSMVLWDKHATFLFPLAKVEKYLKYGPEHNLYHYAKTLIEKGII